MSDGNPSKGDTRIPMPAPPTPAAAAPAAPVAPATPPAAAAPAPAAPAASTPAVGQYADPNALARTVVNGRVMDVPVSDLVKNHQLLSASEEKFRTANILKAQYAADIQMSQELRSLARTNPEMALRRFSELTGVPLGANPMQADDENVDPAIKQVRAQLAALQAQNNELHQFVQKHTTQEKLDEIRAEVSKLPLYQGDAEAIEQAEVVVAAYLVSPAGKDMSVREIAQELHAKQEAMLRKHLTTQRDTRAANAEALATVPPSSGAPGLTQPAPFKASPQEIQRGTYKQKLDGLLANALKGT